MNIFGVFFLTGLATVIRICSGFFISKVVAVYLGPSGLVAIGQFQNFLTITQTFGAFSVQAGIIKYISEYKNKYKNISIYLSAAFFIVIIASIIISITCIFFRDYFSHFFVISNNFKGPILLYSATIFLINLNIFFTSVIQGAKNAKYYCIINITSSVSGALLILFLVRYFNLIGAIYSLALYQSVSFFVSYYYYRKLNLSYKFVTKSRHLVHPTINLLKYGLMAFTSGIVGSSSQFYIREVIINHVSVTDAGYWEALIKISSGFLMIITTTFSVYYLPELSETKEKDVLIKKIKRVIIFIAPVAAISGIIIFLLRAYIIIIFFNEDFLYVSSLMGYQLFGDFIRCISWVFAYIMLAKAMIYEYIISEVFFSITLSLLSYILILEYETIGATYAYCINSLFYLIFSIFVLKKHIRMG